MGAAARGDDEAFREVFRRYAPRIYGFLHHVTGERELAMDLTQETFLKAWSARGRFDPDRPLQPWLFRIAANLHTDARRSWWAKLGRMSRSLFEPAGEGGRTVADRITAPESGRPDRRAEQAERKTALLEELGRLPEGPRRALVLHDLEGLSAEDVALALGRPLGTILSWLKRGREALRARLAARGEDWS